ncbi:MAG: nucleoside diphosphate kinase regulator [Candidatus Omnitrophica bacterium]|nr:nucleoside diphosphate kinase regulator [Candidatus Omnitrophota bacterium]MCA9430890.1 nucleoside diphosphate kinase regulator [Candidatus Omnitrophota bacterium]
MAKRTIYITTLDKQRLEELINVAHDFGSSGREDLISLVKELARAKVVTSEKVPPDVVTMNSKVVLRDLSSSETIYYTLAFPKDANIDEGAISVLAPVGTAILGYRVGDEIEWEVPSGLRRLKIEEILYQPEASGDFNR